MESQMKISDYVLLYIVSVSIILISVSMMMEQFS